MPTELHPRRAADDGTLRRNRRNVRLAVLLGLVAAGFYATYVILHVRK